MVKSEGELVLRLITRHIMKTYGGAEVQLHAFLTLVTDEANGYLNAPAAISLEKEHAVSIG